MKEVWVTLGSQADCRGRGLAVVAAIGVVTGVIAAAVAALPRENRYAIGTQTEPQLADRVCQHSC